MIAVRGDDVTVVTDHANLMKRITTLLPGRRRMPMAGFWLRFAFCERSGFTGVAHPTSSFEGVECD
jgi:hypothetical protein